MSKEREAEIEELLSQRKHNEVATLVLELLTLRRERHRDRLEREENGEVRGKAQECKDLLHIFLDN